MGDINKIPLGFLNMLGSQTGGKNPFSATEIVAPTVDMVPFYHAQSMQVTTVNYTPVGVGDSQEIIVPQDEAWFIYAINNNFLTTSNADRIWVRNAITFPKSATAPFTFAVMDDQLAARPAVPSNMPASLIFPVPIPVMAGARISQTVVSIVNPQNEQLQVLAAVFKA